MIGRLFLGGERGIAGVGPLDFHDEGRQGGSLVGFIWGVALGGWAPYDF